MNIQWVSLHTALCAWSTATSVAHGGKTDNYHLTAMTTFLSCYRPQTDHGSNVSSDLILEITDHSQPVLQFSATHEAHSNLLFCAIT